MAELPTYGDRKFGAASIRVIDTSASNDVAIGRSIASVADTVGGLVRPTAQLQAVQQGNQEALIQGIERDADGNLIAPEIRPEGMSIVDRKYNDTIRQLYSDQLHLTMTDRVAKIANDNLRDPIGFLNAATAYADTTTENIPDEYKSIYELQARAYISQIHRGLQKQAEERAHTTAMKTHGLMAKQVVAEASQLAATRNLEDPIEQEALTALKASAIARWDQMVDGQAMTPEERALNIDAFEDSVTSGYAMKVLRDQLMTGDIEQQRAKLAQLKANGIDFDQYHVPGMEWQGQQIKDEDYRQALSKQLVDYGNYLLDARQAQVDIRNMAQVRQMLAFANTALMEVQRGERDPADLDTFFSLMMQEVNGFEMEPERQAKLLQIVAGYQQDAYSLSTTSTDLNVVTSQLQGLMSNMSPEQQQAVTKAYGLVDIDQPLNMDGMSVYQRSAFLHRRTKALNSLLQELRTEGALKAGDAVFSYNNYTIKADEVVRSITGGEKGIQDFADLDVNQRHSFEQRMTNYVQREALTKKSMTEWDNYATTINVTTAQSWQSRLQGRPIMPTDWVTVYTEGLAGDPLYQMSLDEMKAANVVSDTLAQAVTQIIQSAAANPESVDATSWAFAVHTAAQLSSDPRLFGKLAGMPGIPDNLLRAAARMDSPNLIQNGGPTEAQANIMRNIAVAKGPVSDALRESHRKWLSRHSIYEEVTKAVGGLMSTSAPIANTDFYGAVQDTAQMIAQQMSDNGADMDSGDWESVYAQAAQQTMGTMNATVSPITYVGGAASEWQNSYVAPNSPGGLYRRKHTSSGFATTTGTDFEGALLGADIGNILNGVPTGTMLGKDVKLKFEEFDAQGEAYYSIVALQDLRGGLEPTAIKVRNYAGDTASLLVSYSQLERYFMSQKAQARQDAKNANANWQMPIAP